MKKRLVFLYLVIALLIVLSVILFVVDYFVNKKINHENKAQIKIEEKNTIEYKANQTIRVRYSKTGVIVAMDINDYLRGVVPSEMPPTYNIEALKAQALVARTYTYQKMLSHGEGEDADICDNYAHCQAFCDKEKLFQIWRRRGFSNEEINKYWDKINEAVVSTQNEVIMYNKQYIKAFFHASSPNKTEDIDQIWGGERLPYLVSVENKEDSKYENRTSCSEISFDDVILKLKENNLSRDVISNDDVRCTCINEYTTSGRVRNIKIKNIIISAEKLRIIFGLKSTNFTVTIKDNSICFNVLGYGHGVGMSQVGANFYANEENLKYQDIVKHYYTGVEIVKLM
ncbi:MAG: stage II sporulation protein D [Clostridia bacterium]